VKFLPSLFLVWELLEKKSDNKQRVYMPWCAVMVDLQGKLSTRECEGENWIISFTSSISSARHISVLEGISSLRIVIICMYSRSPENCLVNFECEEFCLLGYNAM
jgi:hypothetical protein